MNFFDYVQLIQNGWDPAPPGNDWLSIRDAIVNLQEVSLACRLIPEATRMAAYIVKMDEKEKSNGRPVE